jgi:hypothetical protein
MPRLDMGLNNYDSSITKRQMSENPEKTEKYNSPRYLYLKHLSTILHTLVNEAGWDIWNPWPHRTPMVEQNYKGEQSSLNSERPSSVSSDYNRFSPRSMGCNSSDSEE